VEEGRARRRQRTTSAGARAEIAAELAAEDAAVEGAAVEGAAVEGAPRHGAKKTLMHYMRQLPNYLRLLFGLMTDKRVAGIDKLLVAGALAYIVMPLDFVPDFIPFLGEVDDVYFLVLALQRLIANAGRQVALAHWSGAPEDLADLNLRSVFSAAAFFLPARIRRRLRGMARR
jgi:uncharacterized membrane protein YkvA (DUF1232 family)